MSIPYDITTHQYVIAKAWTEEQVIVAYKEDPYTPDTQVWCQIMLAGILGSIDDAKNKYPEMWI